MAADVLGGHSNDDPVGYLEESRHILVAVNM